MVRRLRKRDNFLTGEEGGGGRGVKSYDRKKAWASLNHSILSESMYECTEEFDLRWENCLSVLHTRHEPVFTQPRVIPKQSVQCRWCCMYYKSRAGHRTLKTNRINRRNLNLGFGPSFLSDHLAMYMSDRLTVCNFYSKHSPTLVPVPNI